MEPTFFYVGLYFLVSLLHLATSRVDSYGGWNQAPDTQYHIQTDEGEERYFKYQTRSGQYRKEKRLQDGTVVGTYGWVDPNGYLRLRDYIADNAGYRILKSKMIFVGSNADSGESVSSVKSSYPLKYATLVTPSTSPYQTPHRFNAYLPPSRTAYIPPTNHYQSFYPDYQSTTPASTVRLSSIHYYPSSTPVVDISPNSIARFSTPLYVSSTPAPNVAIFQDSTPKPVAAYSSTPKPVAVNYISTPSTHEEPPSYSSTPAPFISSTTPPPISAIGYTASTPAPQPIPAPISGKFAYNNNFITETEKNKLFFQNEKNYYRKRYVDNQAYNQEYDGVSTVQNGFRYFLPRQYHEEQSSSDGQDRQGSFGYIDPFGIRRVIYYNTSPGRGFVHRKNNRYVGFNSTPYDPRPS